MVGLTVCADWEAEMRRVITTIKEKNRRKEYRYRDMCVLFRNFKSRGFSLSAFEEALAQRNVPYIVSGGDRDAVERNDYASASMSANEDSEIIDYLSLIVNTDADESFVRVLQPTPVADCTSTPSQCTEVVESNPILLYCALPA
jgi:superfamily I DNA/RNA helicase